MILRPRANSEFFNDEFPETFSFLVNCYKQFAEANLICNAISLPKEVSIPNRWDDKLRDVESFLNRLSTNHFYCMAYFKDVPNDVKCMYGYATVVALRQSFLTEYLDNLR